MPFEYMKAMAELWGRGGQDFAAAQQNFFANMAKAVGQESPSGVPRAGVFDPQSLTQANQAFAKLWSSAIEIVALKTSLICTTLPTNRSSIE